MVFSGQVGMARHVAMPGSDQADVGAKALVGNLPSGGPLPPHLVVKAEQGNNDNAIMLCLFHLNQMTFRNKTNVAYISFKFNVRVTTHKLTF